MLPLSRNFDRIEFELQGLPTLNRAQGRTFIS